MANKLKIKVREGATPDTEKLQDAVRAYVGSDAFQQKIDDAVVSLINGVVDKVLNDAGYDVASGIVVPGEDTLLDTAFGNVETAIHRYFDDGLFGTGRK